MKKFSLALLGMILGTAATTALAGTIVEVPEPDTFALLGLGLVGAVAAYRLRRK